jgi:hypothetical protein
VPDISGRITHVRHSRASRRAIVAVAVAVAVAAAALTVAPAAATVTAVRPEAAASPIDASGPIRPAARPAVGSVDSPNAAGYAVDRGHTRFRLVRATFFVPYLNCALSKSAYSADWVGLDGFVGNPDSVEEDGIEADCTAAGRGRYHAWHAMYPRPQVTSKVQVNAGDSVTATVFYDTSSHEFLLSLTDNTTGGHFTVSSKCPRGVTCPRNSAEVISSAPDTGRAGHETISRLADYGAMSFAAIDITDQSAQRGTLRSQFWGTTRIVQTQQAAPFQLIARPTQLEASTFDIYWSRAR